MALLDTQARLYLLLEGHLPEMFLLTEVFGRTEAEAEKIVNWQEEQAVRFHPAVREIRILAARRDLREKLGLPAIENEEVTILADGTKVTQVRGKIVGDAEGNVDMTGVENLPPGLRELLKTSLLSQMQDRQPTGFASFDNIDGPGSVRMPGGRVVNFNSVAEMLEAIRTGELKPEEGEGDYDGEDE